VKKGEGFEWLPAKWTREGGKYDNQRGERKKK
jgi:hypothetical protein